MFGQALLMTTFDNAQRKEAVVDWKTSCPLQLGVVQATHSP
jgi:hypothetical protein